ncbi:MAG: ABC transporter ATP-binding protein [Firmicutes bacterium]|nr:ABC transporter ATP-binding protein [Bacillota bacterium]
MIEINNLVKTYENGESKLYALNQVSFTIHNKEFVVILGPSGSGKSTLLNAVSGLEKPDSGSIKYDGREICGLKNKELTAFRREKTAFIFQSYYLLPALNAKANIQMGANLANNKDITDIIKAVGLEGKEKNLPRQLSGGEQQRVSIARAIAKKPEVLFCDEPTGALDETTGRLVMKYLVDLQKNMGLTIVMVTHNTNLAQLATKIIKMNSGKIVEITENKPKKVDEIAW